MSSAATFPPSTWTLSVPRCWRWAFEAYATGNYSTSMLHSELVDSRLTTVPTPKRPSKAPGLTTIQDMLSNPYYKGDVIFRGARYDGLHEPMVSAELWYRVQNVLTAHHVSGEKTQRTSTT